MRWSSGCSATVPEHREREGARLQSGRVDHDVSEPGLPDRSRDPTPQGRLLGAARSAGDSSIRATSPWCRTRNSPKPRPASAASARSICASFSGLTSEKCGILDARHGAAGLSAQGRSSERASARTSDFANPDRPAAAAPGARWRPGRRVDRAAGRRRRSRRTRPRQAVGADHLGVDPVEQLALAVEAAVHAVGAVRRVVALGGGHLDHPYPDERGHLVCLGPLPGGEAGGDAEQGENPVGTEHAGRQGQQHRGVDTAGERHPQPLDPAQLPGQVGRRARQVRTRHIAHVGPFCLPPL